MLVVRRALRAIQPFVAALGAVPVVVSLAVMGGCEVFDPSLVELPAQLPPDAWKKLRKTRISGKLIELTPDSQERRKPRHKDKRR